MTRLCGFLEEGFEVERIGDQVVMMITAGVEKRRLASVALREFEAEHIAVERNRLLREAAFKWTCRFRP
jgi:hypothetical protein